MGCPTETYIDETLTFSICTHDPDTGVLTDADAAPSYRIYEDETATAILTGDMSILDTANTTGFYTELIAATLGNGFEDGKSYTIYIEATVDGDTGGISYGFKVRTNLLTSLTSAFTEIKGATWVSGTDTLEHIRNALTDASPISHSATANNESGNSTLDGGTYASTATNDSTYYLVGPGALVGLYGLDCDLTFGIGTGRVPSTVIVDGHFHSGAQRTVQVWAYNYFTAAYAQLSNSTTDFGNSTSDSQYTYPLTTEMVNVATGAVKIRFTSTSSTVADVWSCDLCTVNSVAQEAAGLTANAIQQAVWNRITSGHDEATLGYNLGHYFLKNGHIVSATDATQFVIDFDIPANDIYNGMTITLEDKTDDHYETRRIVDTIAASNEIIVERAFGFTPVALDDYYINNGAYSDVNITHISGTAQTANDNGADINSILEDTGTTIENRLIAIEADTDELQTDDIPGTLSTIEGKIDTVDTVVDAVKVVTDDLAASATTLVTGTVSHDNTAASTTIFYCDDITEATSDHYNGRVIIFTSGALQNQATDITDYALVSGEGQFTVTALTEAPGDNVTFVIV